MTFIVGILIGGIIGIFGMALMSTGTYHDGFKDGFGEGFSNGHLQASMLFHLEDDED